MCLAVKDAHMRGPVFAREFIITHLLPFLIVAFWKFPGVIGCAVRVCYYNQWFSLLTSYYNPL